MLTETKDKQFVRAILRSLKMIIYLRIDQTVITTEKKLTNINI